MENRSVMTRRGFTAAMAAVGSAVGIGCLSSVQGGTLKPAKAVAETAEEKVVWS